jgi:hypothetical protein
MYYRITAFLTEYYWMNTGYCGGWLVKFEIGLSSKPLMYPRTAELIIRNSSFAFMQQDTVRN